MVQLSVIVMLKVFNSFLLLTDWSRGTGGVAFPFARPKAE